MASKTETDRFHKARLVLFAGKFGSISHRITYGQDIIAIYTPTGHIVGTRFLINITNRRAFFDTQSHTVEIVHDEVDNRQLINLGEIERFVESAIIGCALTHLTSHDLVSIAIG